jgi:ABC-2 type transport system permease protein
VITLVQENVMELTGQTRTRLLVADQDGGSLGKALYHSLEEGHFEIVRQVGAQKSIEDIRAAVIDGDYQVGIVIPTGSSAQLWTEAAGLLRESEQAVSNNLDISDRSTGRVPIHVFFDPAVMPGFRSGLTAQLRMALEAVAMQAKAEQLKKELDGLSASLGMPSDITPNIAPNIVPDASPLSGDRISYLFTQPLFTLSTPVSAEGTREVPTYSPVQQNVPAWALFGMFFTAIPIAGGILQERKSGIWLRLTTLPVSHFLLFTAKVLAYLGVCLCQFLLISLIGAYLFPHIGLPAFSIGQHIFPILTVVLLTGLAACGYGIFLGTVCRTYEQASTLGSTSVVAAAAIGGVMVPVYAMPQAMQRLSIVSPLNWGLTAFHDLLLRGYSFSAILDDLLRLSLFFLLTILCAWKMTRP